MATKYHNRKTTYKGIQFDSQKEENRYGELELLERVGQIRSIELQPRYESFREWPQTRVLPRGLPV